MLFFPFTQPSTNVLFRSVVRRDCLATRENIFLSLLFAFANIFVAFDSCLGECQILSHFY